MFCLSRDKVFITALNDFFLAIHRQLHSSLYHKAPLIIIVTVLRGKCRLFHLEENQLMFLTLQYPRPNAFELNIRLWQSPYDFRILSQLLSFQAIQSLGP